MKISPLSAMGAVVGAIPAGDAAPTMAQKIRSLKMTTNATPGRMEVPIEPVVPELSIPDDNIDTAVAETEETKPLSPQFAALRRKERTLQVKERELSDREKALGERSAAPVDMIPMAKLKSDPLSTMLEVGVTYEQLTEAVLANQNGYNPEIKELKDKLKSLEEGFDKKLTDKDLLQKQAALKEMKRDASSRIAQGDEFALIRAEDAVDQVMELIEVTYDATGEVLDVGVACQRIEKWLLNHYLQKASLEKVRSQLIPQQPALPPPQQQRQTRTLTNRDTASVPMDKIARAIAAFHGNLKK